MDYVMRRRSTCTRRIRNVDVTVTVTVTVTVVCCRSATAVYIRPMFVILQRFVIV